MPTCPNKTCEKYGKDEITLLEVRTPGKTHYQCKACQEIVVLENPPCPYTHCKYYGFSSFVVRRGKDRKGKQLFQCSSCKRVFHPDHKPMGRPVIEGARVSGINYLDARIALLVDQCKGKMTKRHFIEYLLATHPRFSEEPSMKAYLQDQEEKIEKAGPTARARRIYQKNPTISVGELSSKAECDMTIAKRVINEYQEKKGKYDEYR